MLITHCHLCYDLFDQRHSSSQHHYSRMTSSMPNWTLFLSKRTNFHICRGSTWPYRMTSASVNEPDAQSKPGIPEWHVKGLFVWCLNTWNLPSRLICVLFGGSPPLHPPSMRFFHFSTFAATPSRESFPFFPERSLSVSFVRASLESGSSCHVTAAARSHKTCSLDFCLQRLFQSDSPKPLPTGQTLLWQFD